MPDSTSPPWPRQGLSVWWLAGSRAQLWSGPDVLALGCELSPWQLWSGPDMLALGCELSPWQLWSGPDVLVLGCELSPWQLWGSALAP